MEDIMISVDTRREVCRLLLLFSQYSDRLIERLTQCSHQTIGRIRAKLIVFKVGWCDVEKLTDLELKLLLHPHVKHRSSKMIEPEYKAIAKDLKKSRKKRKALARHYSEYRDKYAEKYGDRAYKKTIFYELVNAYLENHHAIMKQNYLPGELACVDYAGSRLSITINGKLYRYFVFVACLGFSKKLFAYVTKDMTATSWTLALEKMIEYFGGVPMVIQFDNAKAMVITPGELAVLNNNMAAFAIHHGCICDTSRVSTPSDNGIAESAVKYITNEVIVVANSDIDLFSVEETNCYIREECDRLNQFPLQKENTTREQKFVEFEKVKLLPQVQNPFMPFLVHKHMKVPSTYLIPYQGHEYSVPYILVAKEITVRITEHLFLAFYNGKKVAEHKLVDEQAGFTRLEEHMPPNHVAQERKSKDTYIAWAEEVSLDVVALIEAQYQLTRNHQSRAVGKRCHQLQMLCKRHGNENFSLAARYALDHGDIYPTDIDLILRAKAYQFVREPAVEANTHENIRGAAYYKEADDE